MSSIILHTDTFASSTGQTSKDTCAVSTSLHLPANPKQRLAATGSSGSVTYSVVPWLMVLLSEQSCSSYRPGVRPVADSPPTESPKQRVIGKMQKASKLAAMMNRMRTGKQWNHVVDSRFIDCRTTLPLPNSQNYITVYLVNTDAQLCIFYRFQRKKQLLLVKSCYLSQNISEATSLVSDLIICSTSFVYLAWLYLFPVAFCLSSCCIWGLPPEWSS